MFLIAIDGPAGSGKGTIAKKVAEKLCIINIDTGAMYRCITLYSIKHNINKQNSVRLIEELENILIDFKEIEGKQHVFLNGEDVTTEIRSEMVNNIVSDISGIQEIRKRMVILQRRLAKDKNVIMEGRDIGTTVFPNANVKIYLDADVEERAKRRYKEYTEKGIETSFDEVRESIIKRDEKDSSRKFGALKMADDAIRVDTTNLEIEQVVKNVIDIIKEKGWKKDA